MISRACPACRRRNVAIAKPVCLQCWRHVPVAHQKAMHIAHRRCLEQPEDMTRRAALDTVIREVIGAARERFV